ncbi:MAG: ATP-binding cassette domain-containing protein [Lachnospiraceae bacterium]|jgi:ABC-type multidrug transport system ATPase subunit|nr:ATP-binding cassette domain-containing protein [Lachnospiraceae bacterium]
MNEKYENAARLLVVRKSGNPEQFPIVGPMTILPAESSQFDQEHIGIACSLPDAEIGKLRRSLNFWEFTNLAVETEMQLDGRPMERGAVRQLRSGDSIRVGSGADSFLLIFKDVWKDDTVWKSIPLEPNEGGIAIYGQDMEPVAKDKEADPSDFRRAELFFKDGKWQVHDLNTRKGVFVNQQKIEEPRELNSYDLLRIGDTIFVFQDERILFNHRTLENNQLVIHLKQRTVRDFLKKHVLLENIDLSIDPGNMVLLLGGSGAGKTTFVNAITGYEKANAIIREGNTDIYRDYDKVKYEIGFVPQQDLLLGEDSVGKTLETAASVRLPDTISETDRKMRIEEVLEMFGLKDQRDTLAEKLSGGQRKRLSIAVEYISDPKLFILDEPDSGLDGVMARDLMERLRKIADQQRIVIVITHTPDRVIDLFDKVIVLAKDKNRVGQLAYYGPVKDALTFFGRSSMEDIVRAVNGKGEGGDGLADEFIEKFNKSRQGDSENG